MKGFLLMKKRSLTYERTFLGNPILQFTKQNVGLDENLLMNIYLHLDNKLSRCPQTFAMRFDIHMPKDMKVPDNRLLVVSRHISSKKKKGLAMIPIMWPSVKKAKEAAYIITNYCF